MSPAPTLSALAATLRAGGFAPRGAFHPDPGDRESRLPGGGPAGTVVLAGQAGPALWERFARERRDEPDPLDAWSARALGAIAEATGAALVLPNDGPPYAPFQRWARRALGLAPSPLGLLIDPEVGLWHALRGALLFAERLAPGPDWTPAPLDPRSPCEDCAERPCLAACPVSAFAPPGPDGVARYDVPACVAHVTAPAGAACRSGGCLARRACPVGRAHAYGAAQQRFHLEAFLRARDAS